MPKFSAQSLEKLATCDPLLQDVFHEAIEIVDIVILEGHRGKEAQNRAVAEGKSQKPWPTGNHNAMPSKAVDAWPFNKDTRIDWKDVVAAGRMMGVIQAIAHRRGIRLRFGLDWDGDFRTSSIADPNEKFLDAPHVELVTA